MMKLNEFVSYAVVQDAFDDNLEARQAIARSWIRLAPESGTWLVLLRG